MHDATAETLFPLGLYLVFHYSPCPLRVALSRYGIQNTRELVGLASIGVRQLGIEPGTFGSSGISVKNLSSSSLNSISETFLRFLIFFGRALKSLGPEH